MTVVNCRFTCGDVQRAVDEQAWQVFDQALSRPATEVPGLRELLSAPTVLDQGATEPPPTQAGR